jgi:hypothetical protein
LILGFKKTSNAGFSRAAQIPTNRIVLFSKFLNHRSFLPAMGVFSMQKRSSGGNSLQTIKKGQTPSFDFSHKEIPSVNIVKVKL